MKQLVIFCSVLLVVIIACIFCPEFRHHYPNRLRLLTSASVCSIPCVFYHVKVFLHQQLGFHFVENFVIIVTFIILIPRHVKAFVLVTFSTCSPSYVFFFFFFSLTYASVLCRTSPSYSSTMKLNFPLKNLCSVISVFYSPLQNNTGTYFIFDTA